MVDQQQQQHRLDSATGKFVKALVQSFRATSERGVQGQKQGAQVTLAFFNRVINNLRCSAAEGNEQLTQQLADQQQPQMESAQKLTQELVRAYIGWVNSTFSFPQQGASAEREGAKKAERDTTGN